MGPRTLTVALLATLVAMSTVAVLAAAALVALGVSMGDVVLIVGVPVMGLAAVLVLAFVIWALNGFRSRRHRRSLDDVLWDVSDIWPGCSLTLLAGLLVLVLGSGVVAQEPSPEPPPWFGGRVEMPEHGFAVTLPDDWVGFDLSVDAASQLEAASGFIGPDLWFADDAMLPGGLAAMGSSGMHLLSVHATSPDHCLWVAVPVFPMPAEAAADEQYKAAIDDVLWDAEPPQAIELPAGSAYLLRQSMWREPPGVWAQVTSYVLDKGDGAFMAVCTTHDTRPDDDWFSIAETIEFLPAEE